MAYVKNLLDLKSGDSMSKVKAEQLHNLISLAANKAAKKLGGSAVSELTYSTTGNLTGCLRLKTTKAVYEHPKYAINFLKLCAKYPNVNSEIIDTILTAGNGEKYYFYGSKKSKGSHYAVVLPVNGQKTLALISFQRLGIRL